MRGPGLSRRATIILLLVLLCLGIGFAVVPEMRRRRELSLWVDRLHSQDDVALALSAALHLVGLGPSGIHAVIDALRNGKMPVRVAAAGALQTVRDDPARINAALLSAAEHDAERSVRVTAGWSLARRGLVEEGLPHLLEAVELELFSPVYTVNLSLAIDFRIREAVDTLVGWCENDEYFSVGRSHLKEVVGGDIAELPKLSDESQLGGKAEVIAEFRAWWEQHKGEFNALEDVLSGRVPPYRGMIRPEFRSDGAGDAPLE